MMMTADQVNVEKDELMTHLDDYLSIYFRLKRLHFTFGHWIDDSKRILFFHYYVDSWCP